jgi:uncharacterized protein YlzI (FlbEa/FlbD family)
MNQEEIPKNYHSYLTQIKDLFDPVIEKMRSQKNEKWKGQAWWGPIKQMIGFARHLRLLALAKGLLLPLAAPGIVVLTGWYNKMPLWSIILVSIILLFGIYYIFVQRYIGKMSTLGCAEFHVEALKATRPEEYKIWSNFIQKDDFTFNGLYASYNSLLVPRSDNSINSVIQYSKGREGILEETIQDLRERIEEYERSIDSIISDVDKSDNAINYLINLITGITTNLYRLTNGLLEFGDLRLVTPFTIYSLKDHVLRKIKDVGTSGGSPEEIDTNDTQDPEYVAVTAAKSKTGEAFVNNPYPGRYVVAFSMKMLEGENWVWCFHFDDSDERALSLVLSNDIIESRQIRRLIHGFCLILQKQMIAKKEAAQDVAENAN